MSLVCICAESPSLSTTNDNISVTVGENVTLSISVMAAVPDVRADSIEWYKDGGNAPIEGSLRQVFGAGRRSLSIFLVRIEDAGSYVVRVRHPAGEFSVRISLEVSNETMRGLTIVQVGQNNVTVDSGEQVSLTCTAFSISTPRIVWLKDNLIISSGRAAINETALVSMTPEGETESRRTSTLTIKAIIPGDGGTYFCRAIDTTSSIMLPFSLMVQQPMPVDFCSPSPCENRGSCVSGESSFDCMCVDGFTGPTCGIRTCEINVTLSQHCMFTQQECSYNDIIPK